MQEICQAKETVLMLLSESRGTKADEFMTKTCLINSETNQNNVKAFVSNYNKSDTAQSPNETLTGTSEVTEEAGD
jgi:hypothetical protein